MLYWAACNPFQKNPKNPPRPTKQHKAKHASFRLAHALPGMAVDKPGFNLLPELAAIVQPRVWVDEEKVESTWDCADTPNTISKFLLGKVAQGFCHTEPMSAKLRDGQQLEGLAHFVHPPMVADLYIDHPKHFHCMCLMAPKQLGTGWKNDSPYVLMLVGYKQSKKLVPVYVYAHRLLCWAMHGCPPQENSIALHYPCKGQHRCICPKHLRWGDSARNKKDKLYMKLVAKPFEKAKWLKEKALELGNIALAEEAFLAWSPSKDKPP